MLSYFFAFLGALVCVYTKDFPGSVIEYSDKLAARWKTNQIASNGYTQKHLDQPLQFQVFMIQALTKEQIYMTQDPETDKEMKRLNRINNFDENSKGKQMKLLSPDRFTEQEFHEQVLTLRNLRTQVLTNPPESLHLFYFRRSHSFSRDTSSTLCSTKMN